MAIPGTFAQGRKVHYIDSVLDEAGVGTLVERLAQKGVKKLEIIDVAKAISF